MLEHHIIECTEQVSRRKRSLLPWIAWGCGVIVALFMVGFVMGKMK